MRTASRFEYLETMAYSGDRRRHRGSGYGRRALAQLILFFIGLLTIFISALGMRDAHEEVVLVGELAAAQAKPDAQPPTEAEVKELREKMTAQFRFGYGVDLALGVLFVTCALLVHRFPVIATVTGLTLYLGSLAMVASVDPRLVTQGIVLKVLVIIALTAAVSSAIRTERRRNRRRRREEVGDEA